MVRVVGREVAIKRQFAGLGYQDITEVCF